MTYPGAYRDEQAREEHVAEEARALREAEESEKLATALCAAEFVHDIDSANRWADKYKNEIVRARELYARRVRECGKIPL